MRLTNNLGMPEEFVRAVQDDPGHEPKEGCYSVSDLVSPPWITYLRRKYRDCYEDASNRIQRALGTGFHLLMERQDTDDYEHEVRMEATFGGRVISGRMDRIRKDGTAVYDYKTCKWNKIGTSDFKDWDVQGRLYCWLMEQNGMHPEEYVFYAIVTDYSVMKAARESGGTGTNTYVPFYVYRHKYGYDERKWVEDFIEARIQQIECPTPCTDEERWAKPTVYAVVSKKLGAKTVKLFSTEEDARKYADAKNEESKDVYKVMSAGGERTMRRFATEEEAVAYAKGRPIVKESKDVLSVEERKGEGMRCLHYCPFSSYCKKEKENYGKRSTDSGRERSWEDGLPS